MSYDIELQDPVTKRVIEFETPHQMRGGTYQVGGSSEASLNVTYNYSRFFYDTFGKEGIRTLYGMSGADSIHMLDAAIDELGNDVDEDYWEATEGNAKKALIQLKALATLRPDGVWDGD